MRGAHFLKAQSAIFFYSTGCGVPGRGRAPALCPQTPQSPPVPHRRAHFSVPGYNESFGNASAFYNEVTFTCGFLLKCGASQSPNPSVLHGFSAHTALNLQTLFSFLASTFPNGALSWLNQSGPFTGQGGQKPNNRWPGHPGLFVFLVFRLISPGPHNSLIRQCFWHRLL